MALHQVNDLDGINLHDGNRPLRVTKVLFDGTLLAKFAGYLGFGQTKGILDTMLLVEKVRVCRVLVDGIKLAEKMSYRWIKAIVDGIKMWDILPVHLVRNYLDGVTIWENSTRITSFIRTAIDGIKIAENFGTRLIDFIVTIADKMNIVEVAIRGTYNIFRPNSPWSNAKDWIYDLLANNWAFTTTETYSASAGSNWNARSISQFEACWDHTYTDGIQVSEAVETTLTSGGI